MKRIFLTISLLVFSLGMFAIPVLRAEADKVEMLSKPIEPPEADVTIFPDVDTDWWYESLSIECKACDYF